ncbi:MAG: undecaprenyl diphosphate synthase family protein, partial [Dehalococcoidales bacterium]|nr:undecaprenyl diphosphate synthase family protein [Dehalococcoidales bacterium]
MTKKSTTPELTKLPTHLAIVPDGNGRWAEQRGLPRLSGHRAGAENMRRMIEYLNEYPIKYVTLYGFSTEN